MTSFDMKGQVVLVTGGCGFLGQHIVRLLQECTTNLQEIRVFDVKGYQNKLDHISKTEVRSVVGNICDKVVLDDALRGVTSVIHTAGVVSFGRFPDHAAMEDVNVKGTANLIQSCIDQGVRNLIYTSTIDVVIGYDDIINGDETLKPPKKFLFSGYPDTKLQAERLVLSANGRMLSAGDGSTLKTMALRPNVMFGELDPYFVIAAFKNASKAPGGVLARVGRRDAKFQQAYVGNVAWAHLCACAALNKQTNPPSAGQAFFITDDTPIRSSFDFMEPFLQRRGLKLSSFSIPFGLVHCFLYATETMFWLLSSLYKVNSDLSLASLIYINMDIYFSRNRAESLLGYKPLFDYKSSLERSFPYYDKVDF